MQEGRGEWGLPFQTGLSLFQSKVRGIWHHVVLESVGMTKYIHNSEWNVFQIICGIL